MEGWGEEEREMTERERILKNVKYSFQNAKEEFRSDPVIALAAVKADGNHLKYVGDQLKKSREIVLEAVKNCGNSIRFADEALKEDKEIVIAAINSNANSIANRDALRYCALKMRDDKDVILAACEDGESLQYASDRLKDDDDVGRKAVKTYGELLEYLSPRLKNNREIVLQATKEEPHALNHASDELKDDRDLLVQIINENGRPYNIRYASERLLGDVELIKMAVKKGWSEALKCINKELRTDKSIVTELYKVSYLSWEKADPSLRDDRDFVLSLMKETQKAHVLAYSSERLQNDEELFLYALGLDKFSARLGSKEMKHRPEILLEILKAWDMKPFAFPGALEIDEKKATEVVKNIYAKQLSEIYASGTRKQFVIDEMKKYGYAFKFVSGEMKDDVEILESALSTELFYLISEASERLKNDEDVVMRVLKSPSHIITWFTSVGAQLRDKIGFVRKIIDAASIYHKLEVFKASGPNVRNNEEFVKDLIRNQKITIFTAASDELRNNKKFVSENLMCQSKEEEFKKDSSFIISKFGPSILDDGEIMRKAIGYNGSCIQFASERLKNSDRELALLAVRLDSRNFEYLGGKMKLDEEVLKLTEGKERSYPEENPYDFDYY